MRSQSGWTRIAIGLIVVATGAAGTAGLAGVTAASSQPAVPAAMKIPQPGVPEIVRVEGKFVRAAYNDEGYVVLGYQPTQRSIGEEWMLLDFGATLLDEVPSYVLNRAALSIETPDGKTLPLATVSEQRAARLQNTANLPRDPIHYFPRSAYHPCRLGFYPELNSSELPNEEVELNPDRACIGRIYFHVPGGVALGEHWLNVKFAHSVVRVPFTLQTADKEQ